MQKMANLLLKLTVNSFAVCPQLILIGWLQKRESLDIHISLSYYVYKLEVIQVSRTNIVLDDTLVAYCQKATGLKTRRALIDHALQELLRHERQKKVLELKGTIRWEGDLSAWRKKRG